MSLSNLILIVYYPCCAGGNFVINSLGLSRHCTLHEYHLAQWDASQTEYNQQYYQTKLNYILKTIPDTKNDSNWTKFEMHNFFQLNLDHKARFLQAAAKITKNNQYFCIGAHDNELYPIVETTNSTQVIKLTNFCKWMEISAFKHQSTINNIDEKLAYYKFVDEDEIKNKEWFFTIDIDQGMQEKSFMQAQIETLYKKLGWEDFNSTNWSQYYQKYINSHLL